MTIQNYYGTGRRKSSVAKVFMHRGKGVISVNNTSLNNYFKRGNALVALIHQPFVISELLDTFDVIIYVKGGGERGQAEAIRLGISRALLQYDDSNNTNNIDNVVVDDSKKDDRSKLHSILRNSGMLTRDSRVVERKKVGHHKARKSSQFSKR